MKMASSNHTQIQVSLDKWLNPSTQKPKPNCFFFILFLILWKVGSDHPQSYCTRGSGNCALVEIVNCMAKKGYVAGLTLQGRNVDCSTNQHTRNLNTNFKWRKLTFWYQNKKISLWLTFRVWNLGKWRQGNSPITSLITMLSSFLRMFAK